MLLYHGTDKDYRKFALNEAKNYKDFGKGIYLTADKTHAEKIARKHNTSVYYVRVYDVNIKDLEGLMNIHTFRKVSISWVKYVLKNRNEIVIPEYDVVIGATADAKAQDLLEKFYRRHKSKEATQKEYKELIKSLSVNVYPIQYCLLTPKAVKFFNQNCVKVIKYGEEIK